MTRREKTMVGLAAGIVGAFVLFAFVVQPLRERSRTAMTASDDESLRVLLTEISRKERLAGELDALKEKLSVKVPSESIDAQNQAFVRSIEAAAGKLNIKFMTFSPSAATARADRRRPGDKSEFELKFATNHGNFVKFVRDLEQAGAPFAIESLSLKGNAGGPDALEVQMSVSFTFLEPIADENPA